MRCYVEHAPERVECPEHGVRTESVPWARCAASRFTSAFEDEVAWLSGAHVQERPGRAHAHRLAHRGRDLREGRGLA